MKTTTFANSSNEERTQSWRYRASPQVRYALPVVLVAVALASTIALKDFYDVPAFHSPIFFCAIVISSWFGGGGPGIFATALSFLTLDLFLKPPLCTLDFPSSEIPRFVAFGLAGWLVSWLGGRQRRDEEELLRARDGLEQTVRARTVELQVANVQLAAMAREREMFAQQRATQLAKANEALRGSLDALASVPELDEFIGQVMAAITGQLGAVSSSLRMLNRPSSACLCAGIRPTSFCK